MVGIRDAHVEKHTPDRKKNKLNTMRCFCLISIAKLSANVSAKVFIPAPVVVAAHSFAKKITARLLVHFSILKVYFPAGSCKVIFSPVGMITPLFVFSDTLPESKRVAVLLGGIFAE